MDSVVAVQTFDARERIRCALLTNQGGILTSTRQRLARIAHARGMEASTIDDIIQETLLEAWSHLDRRQTPASFSSWIDAICRNVCRRFAHRHTLELRRHTSLPHLCAAMENADEQEDAQTFALLTVASPDPLEGLELTFVLEQALRVLPEVTRQLVELCYVRELPRAEVAAHLGIKSGALETRLYRVRRQLYQLLHGGLTSNASVVSPARYTQTTRLVPRKRRRGTEPAYALPHPECSRQYNQDTVHSMGLVSLSGLRSLQPTWTRTMQGLSECVTRALAGNARLYREKPALIEVQSKKSGLPGPPGHILSGFNCTAHSAAKRSIRAATSPWSSSWSTGFIRSPNSSSKNILAGAVQAGSSEIYQGQRVLRLELNDRESSSQLTIFAHLDTLRVLAIFPA
jgi:RNA polymerase sigma-70 factor (ECF subfamily)